MLSHVDGITFRCQNIGGGQFHPTKDDSIDRTCIEHGAEEMKIVTGTGREVIPTNVDSRILCGRDVGRGKEGRNGDGINKRVKGHAIRDGLNRMYRGIGSILIERRKANPSTFMGKAIRIECGECIRDIVESSAMSNRELNKIVVEWANKDGNKLSGHD